MKATEWIYCPICGNKTRTMIREDTELRNCSGILKLQHLGRQYIILSNREEMQMSRYYDEQFKREVAKNISVVREQWIS